MGKPSTRQSISNRLRARWRAASKVRKRLVKAGTGFVVLLGAIGALLGGIGTYESAQPKATSTPTPSTSAAALAKKYDGSSPIASGCYLNPTAAPSIDQVSMVEQEPGAPTAIAYVRHSLGCDTTWLQVHNPTDGVQVYKYVKRSAGGGLPSISIKTRDVTKNAVAGNNNDLSYSVQVYAPKCVDVRVVLESSTGTVIGSVPWKEECT